MKNINKITKQFFNHEIKKAEEECNEVLESLNQRYDEETASMFYISGVMIETIQEWLCTKGFDDDKIDRLSTIMQKKINRDAIKWLEYNNPFNSFMRNFMRSGL